MGRGKGKGGKGGGSAPKFNRQVPKFLQQYAHLLGAERPDPGANDEMGFQSNAIEEGYDSDGDQVVDNFLKQRQKDKRDAEEAAAREEAEQRAREDGNVVDETEPSSDQAGAEGQLLPKKVLFQKRPAADISSLESTKVEGDLEDEGKKKKKKEKKTLNNKK
jgi:hypothetical protein